jgi:large conductance mechanosensitive channel
MLREFREFATRGNVIDLAIGIIIGTAFLKIVDSLVKDVIMPPFGLLLANVDFSNLFVTLGSGSYETLAQAQEAGAATINYGLFINEVIGFIIVAFAVFLLVKQVNRMRRREVEAPTTKECEFCCSSVPLRAIRCPHCTGTLAPAVG